MPKDVPAGELSPEIRSASLPPSTSQHCVDSKPTEDPRPESPEERASVRELFYFATASDKWAMLLSCILAAAAGVGESLSSLILGEVLNGINDPSQVLSATRQAALSFLILAVLTASFSALAVSIPVLVAERQMKKLREEYFKALLHQHCAWFDSIKAEQEEISNNLVELALIWREGIAEKLQQAFKSVFALISGLSLGFYFSWQVTLLVLAITPAFALLTVLIHATSTKNQSESSEALEQASARENEVLTSVRIVAAFNGLKLESELYSKLIKRAREARIKQGWAFAAIMGTFFLVMYAAYAYSMYVGGILVRGSRQDPSCTNAALSSSCVTGGSVLLTFFVVISCTSAFSASFLPAAEAMFKAQVAAAKMFKVMRRAPAMSITDQYTPESSVIGRIEFRDVCFSYPARPDVPILTNFSLVLETSKSVALTGASGSGKSTIVALLLRLYEPDSGSIFIDGIDIKSMDVKHLRAAVGLVSQEPMLFSFSVRENIALGHNSLAASDEDIRAASVAANAHEFVTALPEQYDTVVGASVRAVCLSGGQRQRLCIARCLLRKPAVMIFDEATSALDNESERQVQASIDSLLSASSRPTSLVIAHRLSTIVTCDVICVLEKGCIVQRGTHAELMADTDGVYHRLQSLQQLNGGKQPSCDTASPCTAISMKPPPCPAAHLQSFPSPPPYPPATTVRVARSRNPAATSRIRIAAAAPGSSSMHECPPSRPDVQLRPITTQIDPGLEIKVCSAQEAPGFPARTASQTAHSLFPTHDLKGEFEAPSQTFSAEKRLWKSFHRHEILLIAVALVLSAANGGVNTVAGLVIAEATEAFYLPDEDMEKKLLNVAGYFMACGTALFVTNFFGKSLFTYTGEALSTRLRIQTFRQLMRMEVGYFDEKSNNAGALEARLSTDAAMVQAGTGEAMSQLISSFGALTIGIAIAMQASWRIGLIVLATIPLTIASGYCMMQSLIHSEMQDRQAMQDSNHVACESMAAIRTVTAFNLQQHMLRLFTTCSNERHIAAKRKALKYAANQFAAEFLQNAVNALAWYVGGIFISNGDLTFAQLMQAFLAVQFAGLAVEQSFNFGPEKSKAICAAESIFGIIDRPSKIDAASEAGETPATCKGRIEFKNVTFAYPTRPEHHALRNFSLVVEGGESVALVGRSGSGKSSVIALLLRFYDPQAGAIFLDGVDIRLLNLKWLRDQLGYVQQEPALFCGSIKDNIQYGLSRSKKIGAGCHREPFLAGGCDHLCKHDSQDTALQPCISMENAALQANAHQFIQQLPLRYETTCGTQGSQLSGGQKQRIAIARMLMRQAPIMLLDEATSALDSESEKLVQDTLYSLLGQGRTLLIVAHRLSTVKNCTRIAVMQKGELVEEGIHEHLLQSRGPYWQLVESQQRGL
jgi:ATP-binding cassette subfamily B (MDR/TAP) protein 1